MGNGVVSACDEICGGVAMGVEEVPVKANENRGFGMRWRLRCDDRHVREIDLWMQRESR